MCSTKTKNQSLVFANAPFIFLLQRLYKNSLKSFIYKYRDVFVVMIFVFHCLHHSEVKGQVRSDSTKHLSGFKAL